MLRMPVASTPSLHSCLLVCLFHLQHFPAHVCKGSCWHCLGHPWMFPHSRMSMFTVLTGFVSTSMNFHHQQLEQLVSSALRPSASPQYLRR